jgi:hypothetical protein
MGKPRSCWSTSLTVALLVGLLLACPGIRQDELACEDAVAHLQHCCPGFTGSNIACTYTPGCGPSEYPELGVDQSSCLRNESCDQLRSSGVCERATAIPMNTGEQQGSDGPSLQACP